MVVQGSERKKDVASTMMFGNVKRIIDAPVTLIFAADLGEMLSLARLCFISTIDPVDRLEELIALEEKAGAYLPFLESLPQSVSLLLGGRGPKREARSFGSKLLSCALPITEVPSNEVWAYKNTMLAAQTFMLAATAAGLVTCPLEGFDGRRLRSAVGLPDKYSIPLAIAVGFPSTPLVGDGVKTYSSPRFPFSSVFFKDTYGVPLFKDASVQ